MSKKILVLVSLVMVFLFVFTACSPTVEEPVEEEQPVVVEEPEVEEPEVEEPEVEEPEVEEPVVEEPEVEEPVVEEPEVVEPLTIAVVSPSTINDYAYTQSMYDAVTRLQEDMGEDALEFVYSENMFVVDDGAAAIRDYASQGYDIVLGHGSQYGSSIQEIAPDFPETSFAWGTTVDTFGLDNVYSYTSDSHEGGYVNGVMAALLTESKVIGVVGSVETGDIKLYVEGFVLGVESVDPEIEVRVTYIGSFSDIALAAEAAETHIAAGADVLTGTSQMVVGAIGKAADAGAYWFGYQADQAPLAPDTVVACQVYDWKVMLDEMVALREEGVIGGQLFVANLENGGQRVVVNPDIDIPEEVKQAYEDTLQGIIDGTIVVELPE